MKVLLRNKIKLKRLNHRPEIKQEKDRKICIKLASTKEFQSAKNILFYMPIHGEVDLKTTFYRFKKNKKFILPKVDPETRTLSLFAINELHELKNGSYNIPEPTLVHKEIPSTSIDLAIVPGIVFGRNGHRIGFGKGFYDKLLKTIKCPKFGIAYDFQIVENVPGETHDVPMDKILTEKQTIRI